MTKTLSEQPLTDDEIIDLDAACDSDLGPRLQSFRERLRYTAEIIRRGRKREHADGV